MILYNSLENKSAYIFSDYSLVKGGSKKDWINAYSGTEVDAGEGDDALFAHYREKENILYGGKGRDQFIFIARDTTDPAPSKTLTHVIGDFSAAEDWIEIRGYPGINTMADVKRQQVGDDVELTLSAFDQVKILNVRLDQLEARHFIFSHQAALSTPGNLQAITGKGNHLFGSGGADTLDGNHASFVHLWGGAGNDRLMTNHAWYALIDGNGGDDSIECTADTAGRISYWATSFNSTDFGHDRISGCNWSKMKLEVLRQGHVAEMLRHLTTGPDGIAVFKGDDWSITLTDTLASNVNAGMFAVWEEV